MKKLIAIWIASATFLSAQAQLLSPQSVNGALWGGLIGGVIGGDRHHGFSGNGAAIGAGVGLLAGSLAGNSHRYSYYDEPVSYYSSAPQVSFGYGYGHGYGRGYGSYGSSAYVYHSPNNYLAPGYYYRPTRPNYAVSGTILGATSGALIGAGRHDAGKGALIGAAAGLALGSVAEHATRREEQRVIAAQAAAQPVVASASQTSVNAHQAQVTPAQITSKPSASSTYYWTPRPQIADAPRVPDAPTY